ncbi:MAG: tail fiber domain-containing protein [Bacteroidetes bacterium]|nr:tail fiber domain-containing protein [Bacteroidota bacterium]MBK8342813.1 tail fiber domain-containing protein [Bacteroidota bacterium]
MKKLIYFIATWILISIPVFIFGQANTDLSNLTPTSINSSLIPATDASIDLGSSALKWNNFYISGEIRNATSVVFRNPVSHCFVGVNAGKNVPIPAFMVAGNTFCGNNSGFNTGAAGLNSFFGYSAGYGNITGVNNSVFGAYAGGGAMGSGNCFFGANSGQLTTGNSNCFFGSNAGAVCTTGFDNTFMGDFCGSSVSTGIDNVLLGAQAGNSLTTGGNNICLGSNAGIFLKTGSNNTFIGTNSATTAAGISNATAIGFGVSVSANNSFVLGNNLVTKYGFGKNCSASNVLDFQVTTAKLTTGGVWTNASDPKLKDQVTQLDKYAILDKVNQLDIARWHYKADEQNITHIGPMADAFYKLFEVGDDSTISTIDPSGVALIAIQALTEQNKVLQTTNAELEKRLAAVEVLLSSAPYNEQIIKINDNYYLEQNSPNPFKEITFISYQIPPSAISPQLLITSSNGITVKLIQIEPGSGKIELDTNTLPSGNYNYSLVINGKVVASKTMIIVR